MLRTARLYGVEAVNHALSESRGTTALHLCFGHAALVARKQTKRYAYLEELADASVQQISIDATQPRLDLAPLKTLAAAGKTIVLGTLDPGDPRVESAGEVAARIRAALACVPAEQLVVAPDCGMTYLPREVAFGKLVSMVEGAAIVRRER